MQLAAWQTFAKERIPLGSYMLLSSGIAISPALLATSDLSWMKMGFAVLGVLIFFIELRLMDEYKDQHKDKVAHPDRPIPRGLVSPQSLKGLIHIVYAGMLAFSIALSWISIEAALWYGVTSLWLGLMYREFFIGKQLSRYPYLYAWSHQIILIFLVCFAMGFWLPGYFHLNALNLGLLILGAFFAYEICRKLDPKAHKILGTYLVTYGKFKTFLMVASVLVFSTYGAWTLGFGWYLWPLQAGLLLSLSLLWTAPEKYKLVETLATINLIAHIWAGCLTLLS